MNRVSILIPAFNEAATLAQLVDRVVQAPIAAHKQIVLVDDGSTDATAAVVPSILERYRGHAACTIVALAHDRNRGKGAAVRTALASADGDVVIIQDADLEYDPRDYPALLKPIDDGVARVVYGTRWVNRHLEARVPGHWRYLAGSWLVTRMTNLLYGAHITDEPTGYKVFDASVLRAMTLRSDGFDICPELTAKVRKAGHTIREVPIAYTPRSIADGKKIRAVDGARAIWTLVRERVTISR